MKVSEALRLAASLIEPEGAWTKDAEARDRKGAVVKISDPSAVSFDVRSAIEYVCRAEVGLKREIFLRSAFDARVTLRRHLSSKGMGRDLVEWNDAPERTQAEVVSMLRECADCWCANPPGEGREA